MNVFYVQYHEAFGWHYAEMFYDREPEDDEEPAVTEEVESEENSDDYVPL
jgi:hypothetical protein